jgi:uncharacterized membrane protein YoaK (UPF0700 family)
MFTKPTPPWITAGALCLAGCAGCINAVGFLGAQHQALSHMSGTVTNLGIELGLADRALAWRAFVVLGSFFLGCVASGLIIRQSTLKLGRRYGVALVLESLLLFAAVWFFHRDATDTGDYLAAMACGLQNAMATGYSGAVIRTTHVSGIITDLGIAVGLFARRQPVDWRRIRLYLVLLVGFLSGGVIGAVAFVRLNYGTLLIPAVITGVVGLGYGTYRHFYPHAWE